MPALAICKTVRLEERREGLWPGRSHVQRQVVLQKAAGSREEPHERIVGISGR